MQPQVAITGVTINSPPVVKFTVKDAAGNPVLGLGNKSKNANTGLVGLTNIGFTLAKLVPGTNNAPSKWVNYLVFTPATIAQKTAVPATASCDAATNATWCGTYPTYDREGTLIDFGDGSYQYTFYRDVKQAATIVASLTDSADGLSKKADLGDLTFDPTLTHRLGIQIGGNAPGTGSNYVDSNFVPVTTGAPTAVAMVKAANIVYDFRPDGGTVTNTRNVVTIDSCAECHAGLVLNHGSRTDPNYCATCHTDQIRYSFSQEAPMLADGVTFKVQTGTNAQVRPNQAVVNGRAVGNLPNMIHHIHMGENLVKQGYHFNNDDLGLFNEVKFPQDLRNCTKCHDGSASATHKTSDGDNWKNVPSRLACGACHDGIDFSTGKGITLSDAALIKLGKTPSGVGHIGGAKADDTQCVLCHDATTIPVYHTPVTPIAASIQTSGVASGYTNAASVAGNQKNLPAGAIKVTYDLSSVSRNSSKQPVVVFRILQNGARADFNTYSATGKTELWDNFVGSPSAYFVFAVPQDGITAPADFNVSVSSSIKNLWKGTATGTGAGTLTGPDANGYYTATLTGTTVPDSAVMLTGGIGFTYDLPNNPPLTQTNLSDYPYNTTTKIGGLIVAAPTAQKVATGYTGRRQIVENARCNKCHEVLGVFTEEAFHSGQRNDANTCNWCHRPNQTSSGWSADSTVFVHGIHAGDKRTVPFTWHAADVDDNFSSVGFPGGAGPAGSRQHLKQCETCHLPGTYDFSASASASALPNRLYRTVGTGIYNGTAGTVTTGSTTTQTALGVASLSPYVTADNATSYGAGFSYNIATGVTTPAAATTLVTSPIATACFSCHDTDLDRQHMESNGGSIYQPRSTALVKAEQCTLCHLTGKVADIAVMHAK